MSFISKSNKVKLVYCTGDVHKNILNMFESNLFPLEREFTRHINKIKKICKSRCIYNIVTKGNLRESFEYLAVCLVVCIFTETILGMTPVESISQHGGIC